MLGKHQMIVDRKVEQACVARRPDANALLRSARFRVWFGAECLPMSIQKSAQDKN